MQVAVQVFQRLLQRLSAMRMDSKREAIVDMHAQFLLVKFNHIQKNVRIVADQFLTDLAKAFPHVMWSGRVLFTMLDITELLSQSLEIDMNQATPVYTVPDTSFQLVIMDSHLDRQMIISDFVKRCTSVIEEGLKWAPQLVRSHLAEYTLQREHSWQGLRHHTGLAFASELVFNYAGCNRLNAYLGPAALDKRPNCAKRDFPNFLCNLTLRSKFQGEAIGLIMERADVSEVVTYAIESFEKACARAGNAPQANSTLFETIQASLFRITALLVVRGDRLSHKLRWSSEVNNNGETPNLCKDLVAPAGGDCCTCYTSMQRRQAYMLSGLSVRRLLQQLCMAPLKLFTAPMMELAISCWYWLLSARSGLTLQFINELSAAWKYSVERGMGAFSEEADATEKASPLLVSDNLAMTPNEVDATPHAMWVGFLAERLYIAQCSSQDQLQLFVSLLQTSLAGEVSYLVRSSPLLLDSQCANSTVGGHVSVDSNISQACSVDSSLTSVTRLSRSVSALSVRFRLVKMVLGLLQSASAAQADATDSASNGSGVTTRNQFVTGGTQSAVGGTASVASPGGSLAAAVVSGSNRAPQGGNASFRLPPLLRLVLREKVYSAILNYFSVEPCYPVNSGICLRDDLQLLISVRSAIASERHYLSPVVLSEEAEALSQISGHGGGLGFAASQDFSPSSYFPNGATIGSSEAQTRTNVPPSGVSRCSSFHQTTSSTSPQTITGTGHQPPRIVTTSGVLFGSSNTNNEQPFSGAPTSGIGACGTANSSYPYSLTSAQMTMQSLNPYYQQFGTLSAVSKRSSATGNRTHGSLISDATIKSLYQHKRSLILLLLASEIERLVAWNNPQGKTELTLPEEADIEVWLKKKILREKNARDWAELAWEHCPAAAIFLQQRFRCSDRLREEIARLVRSAPTLVSHIPAALQYLATPSNLEADVPELSHILSWAPVSPVTAISYFSRMYPQHPLTHQYAVRVLAGYAPETLIFYVPQLVQGIRYDKLGYMNEFILSSAHRSPILAHQLLWNMRTNIFRDEEGNERDVEIGAQLEWMSQQIAKRFSGPALEFYKREFAFFDQITGVSAEIRPFPKGPERKAACLNALKQIKLQTGCYLPSNPDSIVLEIDYESGTPMQSAAKAPFLARFKVMRCGVAHLERTAIQAASTAATSQKPAVATGVQNVTRRESMHLPAFRSPFSRSRRQPSSSTQSMMARNERAPVQRSAEHNRASSLMPIYWQACIFKVGDDVRQDILALQVIQIFKNVFQQCGLDLFLYPYRVIATGPGSGVIECVPDSKSRDQIGRQMDSGMYDYFLAFFGDESTPSFQTARRNFVTSMAAYSLVCYLLQIKDRHNGNIMLDKFGHIIHIDFGFMFESSPGGNLNWEPDMKLTKEMIMIMGGTVDRPPFQWFEQLSVRAFLSLRPYREAIVALVSLMLDSGLPCFRGQTVKQLRQRFMPTLSDREAASAYIRMVRTCVDHWRANTYDKLQYYQNRIPC